MWENLSLSDKEQYLIKSQLQTLKMFRDRNAITHEQYEEALEYLRKSSTYDSDGSNWTITLGENDTPQIEQYPSVRTICPGEGCREHPKKQKCRCGNGSVAAAFIWADTEKALKSRAFGQNEKVGNFYQNYLPFMATVDNNDTVSQSFI